MDASRRLKDHAISCVGLLAILLAGLLYYPGHYFLTSDTQIYTVMMEHQLHPGVLQGDLLTNYPHLAFSLYDEMVNGIRQATGLGYETVMVSFQVLFRALMLGAAYLLAFVLCGSRLLALWMAASIQIVSLVAGPVVCVFEWEPVPRGFSLTLVFLAVALLAAGLRWGAAWALGFGMLFQAGVTYPFLLCFAGWLLFVRGQEPLLRRLRFLLPALAGVAVTLAAAIPASGGPSGLFAVVEPWHLDVIRIRASYNLVSTWPNALILQSLIAPLLFGLSWFRLRDALPKDMVWFFVGAPTVAFLSIPGSWIAMEQLRLFASAQVQPARAMAFFYAIAVVGFLAAGVLANRQGKSLEAVFWLFCGYGVVFLDQLTLAFQRLASGGFAPRALWAAALGASALLLLRLLPRYPAPAIALFLLLMAAPFGIYRGVFEINYLAQDARTPQLLELAEWALQSTAPNDQFHFAGFRKGYQPGVFRFYAKRTVYVDWKAGGQVNFSEAFARQWWRRWLDTNEGRFDKSMYRQLTALEVQYLVVEPKYALGGVSPAFRSEAFVVYPMESIRQAVASAQRPPSPSGLPVP